MYHFTGPIKFLTTAPTFGINVDDDTNADVPSTEAPITVKQEFPIVHDTQPVTTTTSTSSGPPWKPFVGPKEQLALLLDKAGLDKTLIDTTTDYSYLEILGFSAEPPNFSTHAHKLVLQGESKCTRCSSKVAGVRCAIAFEGGPCMLCGLKNEKCSACDPEYYEIYPLPTKESAVVPVKVSVLTQKAEESPNKTTTETTVVKEKGMEEPNFSSSEEEVEEELIISDIRRSSKVSIQYLVKKLLNGFLKVKSKMR